MRVRMREYYERRANEYDSTSYEAPDGVDVSPLTAFVSGLTPRRTLDVACGTGYLMRFLQGEVVGLDQSPTMLRLAHGRLGDVELVHAAVPPLPFADGAFDRVFTSFFYGHLSGMVVRARFVREALRVAQELVVVEQAWHADLPRARWEKRQLSDGTSYRVFKRYFDASELADELSGETVLAHDLWVAARTRSTASASDRAR